MPKLVDEEEHWICSRCFRLYQQPRPDGLHDTCECTDRTAARKKLHPEAQLSRRGLCGTCGLVVLPTASKWAPLQCTDCRDCIQALSLTAGRLVLPIGRHSLMNMRVPAFPSSGNQTYLKDPDRLGERVAGALTTLRDGLELLNAWRPVIGRYNLEQLGVAGDVSTTEYEALVAGAERCKVDKLGRFYALVEFIGNAPPKREF